MKEITYEPAGRILDEVTGNTVVLSGVKLTGIPLQVGIVVPTLI